MWLTLIALVIVVAAIVASAFAGGIYTIVLIPLAAIAVVAWIGAALVARTRQVSGDQTERPTAEPDAHTPQNALPRRRGSRSHASGTPGQLADARRKQQ